MPIPANVTTLSLLLDFDACTSTGEARVRLIEHVKAMLQDSPQVTKLEVSIGSTRAISFDHDFYSAQYHSMKYQVPHKSCAVLGKEFIEDLSDSLDKSGFSYVEVEFDDMLMGDALNQLPPGTTFDLMNENQGNYASWSKGKREYIILDGKVETQRVVHGETRKQKYVHIQVVPKDKNNPDAGIHHVSDSVACYDDFKILMIYMQMQHKAHKNSNEKFMLDFYDDKADILKTIQDFYRANLQLIPSNCCLRINQFYIEGYSPDALQANSEEERTFVGTGDINAHFSSTVRLSNDRHNWKVQAIGACTKQTTEMLQTFILGYHADAIELIKTSASLASTSDDSSDSRENINSNSPKRSRVSTTGMFKNSPTSQNDGSASKRLKI